MEISIKLSRFLFFATVLFSSCNSDVKIGKVNYYGNNCKIISGDLGGLKYIMLASKGKNKYPLSLDFRRDWKPFFLGKTTMVGGKFIIWHAVTDTTNNFFQGFGKTLADGVALKDRSFIPISEEDKKVLYNLSDILIQKRSNLAISKDSVNRLIGWVKVTD